MNVYNEQPGPVARLFFGVPAPAFGAQAAERRHEIFLTFFKFCTDRHVYHKNKL